MAFVFDIINIEQIKNILNFDNIDNKKYRNELTKALEIEAKLSNSSKKIFPNSLQSQKNNIIQNISSKIIKINSGQYQKEKDKKRMAELRARNKPAKMVGVHSSVLELPDDHMLSYKKIKKWIESQEGKE